MSKLSTIHAAYIEEMKSILKLSELLLQKEKNSLNGELKTSGKLCEDFVKDLITTHTPNHLRVTSGYILDPEKKINDDNLPQFDLLLVDNSIPPIFCFKNADIEVVPVESVCGGSFAPTSIKSSSIKETSKLRGFLLVSDTNQAPRSNGNTFTLAKKIQEQESIWKPLLDIMPEFR